MEISQYVNEAGEYIGPCPDVESAIECDIPSGELSDEGAMAVALAGCYAFGFSNAHLRRTVNSVVGHITGEDGDAPPMTRPEARPYS